MSSTKSHHDLPVLQGVLPIHPSLVPKNVVAGVTLAALAIPEVMGYTKIAGTPVITGLYTILIPITLFALFGSSRHLVVGADSATAAIIAGGLAGIAAPESPEWVALTGVLALLVAVILILARIIRLGFLADFLSRTVLTGFLTGVGVQVALGEIGGLFGLHGGGHGTIGKLITDVRQWHQISWPTLLVAALVLVVIVGTRFISRKVPGALIAVIGAIALSWALHLQRFGIQVLGQVPSGLPHLGVPHVAWSVPLMEKLLQPSFALFVVILAQSAATSRAYAGRYNETLNENLDLVGLALANVGAGFSGTFVVNGSPTKTQMVDSAGGRSQLAQLVTAVLVLLVLLFLTKPLGYMPEAVLSAVVFLIGLELIQVKAMQQIFRESRGEFWVALITALTVVLVGVEQGILLAMVLSLLNHVRRGYRPKNLVLVEKSKGQICSNAVAEGGELRPGLIVYRFTQSMYYANAEQLSTQVMGLVKNAKTQVRWFCIDAESVDDIDFTAGATLRSVADQLQQRKVRLVFADVSPSVSQELANYGITKLLGSNAFYASLDSMTDAFSKANKTPGIAQASPTSA